MSFEAALGLGFVLRFCETALFGPVDVLSRRECALEEPQREDEAANRKGRIVTHQREPLLFPLVLCRIWSDCDESVGLELHSSSRVAAITSRRQLTQEHSFLE